MSDPEAPPGQPDHPDQRWTPSYHRPAPFAPPLSPSSMLAAPSDPLGLAVAAYTMAVVLALSVVAGAATSVAIGLQLDTTPYEDVSAVLLVADGLLDTAWFLSLLPAWILTGLWLLRVRQNASVLAPGARHRRRLHWGMSGWITPIVGLWFPLQYVRDLRNAGQGLVPDYSPIVGWWWTAWIASIAVGWTHAGVFDAATDVDPGVGGGPVVVLAVLLVVVEVVAVTLWGLIVRRIVTDQTTLAVARARAHRPNPA